MGLTSVPGDAEAAAPHGKPRSQPAALTLVALRRFALGHKVRPLQAAQVQHAATDPTRHPAAAAAPALRFASITETTYAKYGRTETADNKENKTIGINRTEDVGANDAIDIGSNRTHTVGSAETVSVGSNQSIPLGSSRSLSVGSDQ